MFSEKNYGYKTFILKILESKKNWVHKNVGQKYLGPKYFRQKNLCQIRFDPKNVSRSNNGCNLDAMVSEY